LKNWRTLKTRVHGFLQNCARPKKVCKKTSESRGGGGGGLVPRRVEWVRESGDENRLNG
jgi:hypothetical protein